MNREMGMRNFSNDGVIWGAVAGGLTGLAFGKPVLVIALVAALWGVLASWLWARFGQLMFGDSNWF